MHDHFRGVFATKSPKRPNPIGISVLKLVKVKEGRIYVKDLDIVHGPPLLDIKSYIPSDGQKVEGRKVRSKIKLTNPLFVLR